MAFGILPDPAAVPGSLKPVLERLAAGDTLDAAEAERVFALVMDGAATPVQIAALATALRVRGETVAELAGAARAMRARMTPVPGVADAIDVCGTGGDGRATLNVSTAVAFVLAALGVPVAKHGNRAVSSRAGASDTVQALGIAAEADPHRLGRALRRDGLVFLAAPLHHPAMRYAAPVRAELGFRTIFNLLGPLCNPAGVRRQMIGVFDPRWQATLARVLRALGADSAWIVHGEDGPGETQRGLDELALSGRNRVVALDARGLAGFGFEPGDLGLAARPVSAIAGGDAAHNAAALERLLRGETGAYRDTVLLNAAAALQVSARGGISPGTGRPAADPDRVAAVPPPLGALREGLAYAARVLDDGSALAVLDRIRRNRPGCNDGRDDRPNEDQAQ